MVNLVGSAFRALLLSNKDAPAGQDCQDDMPPTSGAVLTKTEKLKSHPNTNKRTRGASSELCKSGEPAGNDILQQSTNDSNANYCDHHTNTSNKKMRSRFRNKKQPQELHVSCCANTTLDKVQNDDQFKWTLPLRIQQLFSTNNNLDNNTQTTIKKGNKNSNSSGHPITATDSVASPTTTEAHKAFTFPSLFKKSTSNNNRLFKSKAVDTSLGSLHSHMTCLNAQYPPEGLLKSQHQGQMSNKRSRTDIPTTTTTTGITTKPTKPSTTATATTTTTTATTAATPGSVPIFQSSAISTATPEDMYYLALQLEISRLSEHHSKSNSLISQAAFLGYAPAQFKLGICYELGQCLFPVDATRSFHWYRQAALQGHADAELAVSGWYLTGHPQGLEQSDVLAYRWALKAAQRGWSKAEYTLGHYHEVGIGVPSNLNLAKEWYLKSAARGNERALLRLLVGNVGVQVDYIHLKDALLIQNRQNPYLIHQLAQFHELREYGLVPDEEAALELYTTSAESNYAPAQYKLGACYEFGILGCPLDLAQAVHWYGRGADNGHVEAILALAGFYLDGSAGLAVEQSDEEAYALVRTAAMRGVPKAEYVAGFFLENGLGVPQDFVEARRWFRLACAKGVDSAERSLQD